MHFFIGICTYNFISSCLKIEENVYYGNKIPFISELLLDKYLSCKKVVLDTVIVILLILIKH